MQSNDILKLVPVCDVNKATLIVIYHCIHFLCPFFHLFSLEMGLLL